jgi:predicted transcriptional regulator
LILLMAGTRNGRETRERILDAVRRDPGVNKSDLARRLGHSWGTMSHHIQRLTRQGQVRAFRDGRSLLLYPADVPVSHLRQLAALQGEVPLKIMDHLAKGERGIQELVGLVGSSRKVVRRTLQHMDEAGLVGRGPGLHGKFFLREQDWERIVDRYGSEDLQRV